MSDMDAGAVWDVGCGTGELKSLLPEQADSYVGVDVVKHDGFPANDAFHQLDLDATDLGLPGSVASVAVAVETIEHVENPRALVRTLVHLVRPGGLVIITTPNQLSLRAKLSLLTRNCYPAFVERPGLYPAHITALLEIDLRRIMTEGGLIDVHVAFNDQGRVPLLRGTWPKFLKGRAFSDNIGIVGRRPR